MSSRVSDKEKEAALELFSVICRNGGVTNLESAVSSLSKKNKTVVKSIGAKNFVNSSFPNIFKIQDGVNVEAVMPLKFCLDASEKTGCADGESCLELHLCPYFIRGKCSYKEKCRCSHDIKDRHTMAMLSAFGLENIDDATWSQLLKRVLADTQIERGASTHDIPGICKFYNNQSGCREKEKCAFLHVCQHFVDGTCKFGDDCKRDHDLLKDQHNHDVFAKFRLGSLNHNQLLSILRGREKQRTTSTGLDSSLPAGAMPLSLSSISISSGNNVMAPVAPRNPAASENYKSQKSTEICGFFLRGQCNYGDKCMNLHRDLPYQWQLQDGSGWKGLSEDWNIMLERGYSDPSTNEIIIYDQGKSFKTDFDKMIAVAERGHAGPPPRLRRLSTESSAEAPPGHIFSTRWLWYWQDEKNEWQSYDSPDDGCEPNTTCSKSLEKDFLQEKDSHPFSAGHHTYTLYYKRMLQQNDKFQTERAIRRRPEFVAKERMKEIEQRRKEALKASKARESSVSEVTSLSPPHWDEMPDNDDFKRFPLSVMSQEYKDVEKKFQETLDPKKMIKKIERIQNPDLWTAFTQKRGRMAKKSNDVPPKEMPLLFHGTTPDVVDAICQQGFDWRMCGKHGTLYGKGTYFASGASYSHCYTKQASGSYCYMFVARVLVGSYVEGDKSFTRPPPKDPAKPHGDLYDSCVNDSAKPSLFVVFENNQSYPEYLITYKRYQ